MFKSMAPIRCATILPNDSIFVLTGDARRIPFALTQLNKHPDTNLYIIGAGGPAPSEIARQATIESQSESTYQNALAIKEIVEQTGLDRIVVITTEDHINRANHLIRAELPETDIALCPTTLKGMHPAKRLERWTIEYIKYIVTMLGIKER